MTRRSIGLLTPSLLSLALATACGGKDPQSDDTGMGGTEPLSTLARYRKRDGHVYFGQNLMAEGEGVVAVGMLIDIEGEAA